MRKNIRESSEKALENANIALREIKSEKGATENRIGSFPKQEREFTEMYRQREVKQSIYLFLLQKQEENAMLRGISSTRLSYSPNHWACRA